MTVVALILAALLIAPLAMACARVRLRAQVRASADAEGTWRAAAGGAVGPVAFTAGLSPGGTAWSAHVLGRNVARGTRIPAGGARRRIPRTQRAWTIGRAALGRVHFDRLDAHVRGAADDPATSARIAGAIAAFSATVTPFARVTTDVDWMADQAFVDLDCDLEASFVPLLLGWDVARAALIARSR